MGGLFAGDSFGNLWTLGLTDILTGTLLNDLDSTAWTQCGYTSTGTSYPAEA